MVQVQACGPTLTIIFRRNNGKTTEICLGSDWKRQIAKEWETLQDQFRMKDINLLTELVENSKSIADYTE